MKGYSEEWITQRLKSIEIRKDLTSEWNRSGVKSGEEYGILTDEVSKAWLDCLLVNISIIKILEKKV